MQKQVFKGFLFSILLLLFTNIIHCIYKPQEEINLKTLIKAQSSIDEIMINMPSSEQVRQILCIEFDSLCKDEEWFISMSCEKKNKFLDIQTKELYVRTIITNMVFKGVIQDCALCIMNDESKPIGLRIGACTFLWKTSKNKK
jgi:hypothetical protein